MIFVTGPRFSGKRTYIQRALGLTDEEFAKKAACEVQDRLSGTVSEEELKKLADRLSGYEIVTASETGCGVFPVDADERVKREEAGRLACLLAERADVVIRMCCGLPEILKGQDHFSR